MDASRVGRKNPNLEDLSNVEFETSEDVEVVPTFDNMNLREDLLRGIYAYGMWTTVISAARYPLWLAVTCIYVYIIWIQKKNIFGLYALFIIQLGHVLTHEPLGGGA